MSDDKVVLVNQKLLQNWKYFLNDEEKRRKSKENRFVKIFKN